MQHYLFNAVILTKAVDLVHNKYINTTMHHSILYTMYNQQA